MKKILLSLLVSGALLTGCSSTNKITEKKHSGFLSDYSILTPIKEDPGRLGYADPKAFWQQYHYIIIDKVVIITPDGNHQNSNKVLTIIADNYEKILKKKLAKKFHVVKKASSSTIRLQAAITGVFTSYDDLKGYQYIPIAAAFTGAKRASGSEQQRVRVMTELKLVDSINGQLLAQTMDLKSGKNKQDKGSKISLTEVIPILEGWAQEVVDNLERLKINVK